MSKLFNEEDVIPSNEIIIKEMAYNLIKSGRVMTYSNDVVGILNEPETVMYKRVKTVLQLVAQGELVDAALTAKLFCEGTLPTA